MSSAFHVPGWSSGEFQAMVRQLQMIVSRTSGSNGADSTRTIADRRGSWCGRRQSSDVEW